MPQTKEPVIALIYDFDGTLSPKNMQEYAFINSINGTDSDSFWNETAELMVKHNASSILCYMKLMLEKAHESGISIKREQFVEFGKSIELYNGVAEWFDLINQLGKKNGVVIEHYINSSGLKEMIEGTPIAKQFKEIFACSFMYENDIAVWPAVAVDFTAKTQFMFMINKGISKISDNRRVNEFMPEDERPVPFNHMIYFGDGETDIPCMRLVKQQGGISIAVYRPNSKSKKECAERLIKDNRVNFACEADYSKDGLLYQTVEIVIKQIKSAYDFKNLQKANHKRICGEDNESISH